jgi:hypothetical protein
MSAALNQYIAEVNRIYKTGNATEHTYRPALQRLIERMTNGLTVANDLNFESDICHSVKFSYFCLFVKIIK